MMKKSIVLVKKEVSVIICKDSFLKKRRGSTGIHSHWKKRETLTCSRLRRKHISQGGFAILPLRVFFYDFRSSWKVFVLTRMVSIATRKDSLRLTLSQRYVSGGLRPSPQGYSLFEGRRKLPQQGSKETSIAQRPCSSTTSFLSLRWSSAPPRHLARSSADRRCRAT